MLWNWYGGDIHTINYQLLNSIIVSNITLFLFIWTKILWINSHTHTCTNLYAALLQTFSITMLCSALLQASLQIWQILSILYTLSSFCSRTSLIQMVSMLVLPALKVTRQVYNLFQACGSNSCFSTQVLQLQNTPLLNPLPWIKCHV